MQIKTEKGRDFYECESCKKVYSFKVGRKTDYWMRSYCKECAKKRPSLLYFPHMGDRNVW